MAKSKRSNILDPIHAGLSPLVFDDPESPEPKLKLQHRNWIIREVYQTLKQAGYTDSETWLTLYLTGSLTTYQYGQDSDVDVSLFVDSKRFPEWSRAEMIGVMVGNLDGKNLPGTSFPLQNFVVAHDIKPEDLYKPGLRSAYSLDEDKWFVPPEHSRAHNVEQEENGFYTWALQMADKLERLIRYEPDKAVQFYHQIHAKRQRDQAAGKGDFAESNVLYKFLAKRGLLEKISELTGIHIASVKKSAGDWFAPSYMVPDEAKQQINEWTQNQQWPEGTKLAPPERYHVTGIYSPSGFSNPDHQRWVQERSGLTYPVSTQSVDAFSPMEDEKPHPIVVRVHNDDLIKHTEALMNEAEARGLPVSRFEGGYKPHITVAHSPEPVQIEHPGLQFNVGPLKDLHTYYDEQKV
jgi:2'-5' RNA ligase